MAVVSVEQQQEDLGKEQNQKQADRRSEDDKKLASGVDLAVSSPGDGPTVKVLICTLVAPDTPKGVPWVPVYVHAKLNIIDDAFTTLGSANINFRSMNVDSEINIALENGQIATELRQTLWGLHTATRGTDGEPLPGGTSADATGQNGVDSAFKAWCKIATQNKKRQNKTLAPRASLVEFFRESKDRTYKD